MGLKQQVIKGVSWNFIDQIARQIISVGITAVLARILTPSDYGLVALSSIFIGFLSLFGDLSIGSALIQKVNIDDIHKCTTFWTSILTGFSLAIALCIIAPFAASYYDQPLLIYIIDVSAITFIITPIWSTHKILLSKSMEFSKLAMINITYAMISALASLVMALCELGVWSLVIGGLIASVLIIPFVWYHNKWRPRLMFNTKSFRDLFSFSSYLLLSNIVFYFARNFDNLIIGKYLGATVLGIYSMAYNLMMKPLQQVSWSITGVLFPAFSSIQQDIPRIKTAYLQAVRGIALITFPMMMGLMIVSQEFILVMVGPKWEGVILPLMILCPVGALQSIGTTAGAIFNSLGRTDLQFKTGVISSVGHIIGFIFCIRWGLLGLVKGYLFTNIIFNSYVLYCAIRLLKISLKNFMFALMIPTINTSIMMLALIVYRQLINDLLHLNIYINLITSICLGAFIYLTCLMLLIKKEEINELKKLVIKYTQP